MSQIISIPVLIGDKKSDAEMASTLLGELPSIGQTIGKLQIACRRCRKTTSAKFVEYESKLVALEGRQSEIISFVRMLLKNDKN